MAFFHSEASICPTVGRLVPRLVGAIYLSMPVQGGDGRIVPIKVSEAGRGRARSAISRSAGISDVNHPDESGRQPTSRPVAIWRVI